MTREQFLYLKPEDISPEIQPNGKSSKEAALEMIEIANKNGHNRFDWTHVDAEGREFIVDISLMPVVIKGRKMLHTIWRDITESIQAEEVNRVLADIIRKSGDFIGVADPDGRAIFVNPAGKAMMGFDEEFEEAKTVVEDYFFPEDMEIVRNEILPTVMKKGRWAGEFRFRHFKTGEPVYVFYDLFLTSDPSTGKVQNLSTVTRDITELKRSEKALQKSEASFKSMFEKHGAIMLIIEPETGLIIDANDMASDFYGYSKAMLCSMTINDINILSHEEVLCELKAALNEKRNFFIFPHKLANGKIRTVEVHSTPIDFEQRRVLFSIIHDVTERIQAQQALKESEEKMRSIYRVAPTGIGVVVNRVLKEVNPRVCKMTGYSRTELLGNNALMLYPSQEEYELVGKEKYNQISEHGTGEVETRWKKKDGTIINVLLASTPIELNDLSKGVTFTALDITERKRIEAKLIIAKEKAERNENELKKAQKIAHLGSWYLDLETNQVVWTEELYKMYGFDPALPVPPYTEHMKLFTPESWELLSNSLAKTAETNIPYELELKTVKNDGSNGWMWVRGETVSDAEGRTIGLWGAAQDITEHKQTELLLQEKTEEIEVRNEELMDNIAAYAALNEEYATQNEELQSAIEKVEESEAKFREMAELLPQIVFESDLQGYLTYVNKQAYNLTGYSEQDGLIGKSTLSFYILEDRERAIENMKLSLTGNKQAASNEYTMMGKDGSPFNVLVYSNPIVKDNRVVGLRGIIVDVTELKRTEKELVKAKERAEESDRLKSAFLANMSHEIRTPMNGILGFAELLKEPNLSGEEQKRFIGIIEKSGARMLNIINDIVSISKIEAGLMEVNRQDSNVNEQIEYIYTFFKPEVESKGMQLSFKNPLPANEAILKTDREKVYAILTNLVKNAIKYSNHGSIEFGYSLKTNEEHSELEFFVKDTGIGIPKDRQQAIFERFVQADIADKNALQGAGLGLSISKAYVEMLGGEIRVESEVGTGSTFYFTLPYQNGITKEKIPVNEILPALETAAIRKLKVLIAEDDMPSE
ncbi:MAG: PAS domain S-box protein, partial [Bacteroidales bacterium]|nr:PAS domain S-box protein [Bacteroidales bacterium]